MPLLNRGGQLFLNSAPMQLLGNSSGGGVLQSLARSLGTGGKILALGALAPLASLGLYKAIEKMQDRKEASTREEDFKAMLGEAPVLAEDPDRARKHFMTLRRLALDISKDPLLSAGYVRRAQTYENQGVDPSLVANLLLRKQEEPTKKWEVAARHLPSVKVSANTWEL